MSEDLQFYPVDSDLGLLVCHGGINDTALPEELRSSTTCQESSIPDFIQGFLVFLWTMMAFCIAAFFFVIYYLMFMQRGKEKVLKIKNQRQEETNGSHKFATVRVYGSLLFPLLSLIIDYISDFAFIHALVFDFPFDSQFIHLSKPAVGALVIYEIFAIIAFPLTAVTLLIWLNTREGFYEDIQQKMLISSIMYLLDDGPETLLQYYYVDKFSGTDYSYPDDFKTSLNSAILASSIVTFGLALFSFIRLTLRYKHLITQQKRDGVEFKKAEMILLAKYFFVTVIPLAISCLRVFATMYQLDTRRSYLPGCLEYSVEQSANNSFIATVNQPGLFKFDCWIGIDYFLVFGSFFGMFSNLLCIIWYFRN